MFSIASQNRAESASTSMAWQFRRHRGVGPDFDRGAVGSDAGEGERRHDIDISREAGGGLARGAGKHQLRGVQPCDRDAVLDEIGRAGEAGGRLAGDHPHRMDGAFRGGADRIEAEQCAGRHDDLAAMFPGERDEVRARQQGAGAEHHHLLARGEHRRADLFERRGRRAFDDEIGAVGKLIEPDQRALDPGRVEPGSCFGAVARRRAGEREAGHAGGDALRERAPDRAETGNRYPGFVHPRAPICRVRSYAAAPAPASVAQARGAIRFGSIADRARHLDFEHGLVRSNFSWIML